MKRRSYYMTAAHSVPGSAQITQEFSTSKLDETARENTLKVNACSKNEHNDGWFEMTTVKHHEKRSTHASLSLSRTQAEALRDLLVAAYGPATKLHPVAGSIYSAQEHEVKGQE